MEKICPIMAKGWLANKFAASGTTSNTFKKERLPKCYREECGCWVETGDPDQGYCGLTYWK